MVVSDFLPIPCINCGIPIAVQIRTHLQVAVVSPFAALVGALAMQTPKIIRSCDFAEDLVSI